LCLFMGKEELSLKLILELQVGIDILDSFFKA